MPGTGGLAYRQKGPAPATKYFSGNGISVASMCAARHQYRPVAANEGGGISGLFLPLKKSQSGDLWETQGPVSPREQKPHKRISACEASLCPSGLPGTRTPNLLIKSQGIRWSHHVSLNPRLVHKSAKSLGFSHIIAYHRVSGRPAISRAIWTPFGRHLDAKGSSRPRLPYRCDPLGYWEHPGQDHADAESD